MLTNHANIVPQKTKGLSLTSPFVITKTKMASHLFNRLHIHGDFIQL